MDDTVIADASGKDAQRPSSTYHVSLLRRVLTALGLLALAGSVAFGGNLFGVRERFLGSETPDARPAAVSRQAGSGTDTTVAKETTLRSHPWWQRVKTLEGTGATTTPTFTIDGAALRWRLKWTCDKGHLLVQAPNPSRPLVEAACPATDTAYATNTGTMSLDVRSDGPWQLQVDQQVEVPLEEPPLPAMTAPGAVPVSTGAFYRIDQVGRGNVTIYRLADGAYALRLDNFYVTPNVDLEIRLSPLGMPQTTDQFISAPSVTVAPLDVTAGSMNFLVPKEVDLRQYRSVVIWCPPLRTAYAAATLRPAR